MAQEKIKVGVIGCGGRLAGLVKNLVATGVAEIHGGWDPDGDHVAKLLTGAGNPGGRRYGGFEELVKDPDLDWVMVGSPNCFHREHIEAAFAQGKHVFSEKPLATRIEDCVSINRAHRESGKLFATGFVLRYSPIYRRVKKILESGAIGRIISIDANENITPDHGGYIMMNWRRHRDISGPHILEKCVHDLDLLNWFTDSVPVKVAAFGGNDMYVPRNQGLLEKSKAWLGWWSSHRDKDNPFTSDKSIEDNVVSILEYANGMRVQFQATMSNAIPERRMYMSGTEGNLVVELYSGTLKYKSVHEDDIHLFDRSGGDLHGGGDRIIMEELAHSMKTGEAPKCGGIEGLRSAVAGIAIDEARQAGQVQDLSGTWKRLGVL